MAAEKPANAPKDPPAPRPSSPVSSTAVRAHLECTAGPEKGQTLRLAPGVTVLGRDPPCDVVLSETAISRQHCRIERRADAWTLKNLSSNGTLVNKKPVDEVVLSDGDEIRMGAKTRLKFVVEAVAVSASGRPQFRRRSGAEEEAAAAEAKPEAAEGAEKQSLFQRRKGLFIGLGIYLAAVLVFAVLFAIKTPPPLGGSEVPSLGLDDCVIPASGSTPLRIISESPEGTWCEDRLGKPLLVPAADLKAGKATRITGIRKALDVKFLERKDAPPDYPTIYIIEDRNSIVAAQYVKRAIELYRVRNLSGQQRALFGAVRLFQQALAYYGGRGYFEDGAVEKMYQDALRELIGERDRPGTIMREYTNAIVLEKSGNYKQANETYKGILLMIPERENPIYWNVARRIDVLKKQHKDLK
jgi:hypothetical protein